MGINSEIQWTDATHNFWYGCVKTSSGCKNCYMYRDMTRYGRNPMIVTRAKGFYKPLSWKTPMKVFVNSWSDFFIEQADDWRPAAWDVIRQTSHLTYQILTKRPQNIRDRLPDDWGDGWQNVWLGVSVETPDYEWRITTLGEIPANVRFVSAEPLLAPLPNLHNYLPMLDWVITGGESGYNPRPAQMDWFRQLRDDCTKYGVAFFHKQHGGSRKAGGVWGGRELDGKMWDEFPLQATPSTGLSQASLWEVR